MGIDSELVSSLVDSLHPGTTKGCKKMTRSKLIAAAAFTAALGAGAASAADLAARPYTKAPAFVDSIYNWSGFYIDGHIGGATTNEQWVNSPNTTAFGDLYSGHGFRQPGN